MTPEPGPPESTDDPGEGSKSFLARAESLQAEGRYAEAECLLREALEAERDARGNKSDKAAEAHNRLARNLFAQGQYTEAEAHFRRALSVRRRLHGEEHPAIARSYSNLALVLRAQDRNAEAEVLLRKAVEVFHEQLGDGHEETLKAVGNLALVLEAQRKHADAEPLFRTVLAVRSNVYGESHIQTAKSLYKLGNNLSAQERYTEAEPLLQRALEAHNATYGGDHEDTAFLYFWLARNAHFQGRHAEVEPFLLRALEVFSRVRGAEHPWVGFTILSRGLTRDARGLHAEAEPFLRRALQICERALGSNHRDVVQCMHFLASNLHAQGRYAEAAAAWRTAGRGFEAARLRVGFSGLARVAFAAERSPLPYLAACLARNGEPAEAWQELEADMARGLLDDISLRWRQPAEGGERTLLEELVSRVDRLDGRIAALFSQSAPAGESGAGARDLQKERGALLARLVQVESEMAASHGVAAGEVLGLPRIQACLPDDAALVAWVDVKPQPAADDPGGEHWAFVLRKRQAPVCVRLPGSGLEGRWTSEDDELPTRFRRLVSRPPATDRGSDDLAEGARCLHEQRIAPIEARLAGSAGSTPIRRLIVLPAGSMAGIPVEALTDRYLVGYAPSGTMLAWLAEKGGKEARLTRAPALFAAGDPSFGFQAPPGRPSREVRQPHPPLPGTRSEVKGIARLFAGAPGSEVLLGSSASRERLEELAASGRLREFQYLHFATHAVMDDVQPMRSALILCRGSSSRDVDGLLSCNPRSDGELTAREIAHRWKLDAELVTLSACQTALGRPAGGEGYLGFAQAFFLAGANSLVLSLWKVDDRATALLMVRFYENMISGGLPKAEALRSAKEWLRGLTLAEVQEVTRNIPAGAATRGVVDETNEEAIPAAGDRPYAHPFYWAAFILMGDMGSYRGCRQG